MHFSLDLYNFPRVIILAVVYQSRAHANLGRDAGGTGDVKQPRYVSVVGSILILFM